MIDVTSLDVVGRKVVLRTASGMTSSLDRVAVMDLGRWRPSAILALGCGCIPQPCGTAPLWAATLATSSRRTRTITTTTTTKVAMTAWIAVRRRVVALTMRQTIPIDRTKVWVTCNSRGTHTAAAAAATRHGIRIALTTRIRVALAMSRTTHTARATFATATDTAPQTHYTTLGVSENAGRAAVKRAFYELSKQYHPDRNPTDPGASQRFVAITTAYSVLSDPTQRDAYDRSVGAGRFRAPQTAHFGGVGAATRRAADDHIDPTDWIKHRGSGGFGPHSQRGSVFDYETHQRLHYAAERDATRFSKEFQRRVYNEIVARERELTVRTSIQLVFVLLAGLYVATVYLYQL